MREEGIVECEKSPGCDLTTEQEQYDVLECEEVTCAWSTACD